MNTTTTTADRAAILKPLGAFVNLPGNLGQTNVRSLARWCAVGATVKAKTVRLKAVRLGGSWRTCESWIENFFRELTDAATGADRGAK